jgi:hypothetical protein
MQLLPGKKQGKAMRDSARHEENTASSTVA